MIRIYFEFKLYDFFLKEHNTYDEISISKRELQYQLFLHALRFVAEPSVLPALGAVLGRR
jgi:hypothetical protein